MSVETIAAALWLWVPIIVIGSSGLYMLRDAFQCPPPKRFYRIMGAILSWYLIVIYLTIFINYRPDFILTGQATRIGITLSFLLMTMDICNHATDTLADES